jgi:hypothetical protein
VEECQKKGSKSKREYSEREKKVRSNDKKGYEKETFVQTTVTLFLTEWPFVIMLTAVTECIQSADESVVKQQG